MSPGWRGRPPGGRFALCEACAAVEQDILAERDHAQNDALFYTAIANCAHNLVAPG